MFMSCPEFRHPIQFDKDSTVWRAVELHLSTPWLIAECNQEDIIRQVLCDGPAEIQRFIEHAPMGDLVGLILVLPPSQSETGEWQLHRVHAIERDPAWQPGELFSLILVAANGDRYAGPPLHRLSADSTCGTTLRQLRQSAGEDWPVQDPSGAADL